MKNLLILSLILFKTYLISQNIQSEFVSGSVIVKFKSGLSSVDTKDLNTFNRLINTPHELSNVFNKYEVGKISSLEIPLENSSQKKLDLIDDFKKLNIYKIEFNSNISPLEFAKEIMLSSNVIYAEPEILFKSMEIPNDALLSEQWYLESIQTYDAWDKSKGKGQIIAILDTGVDPDHPDLKGQLLQGYDFVNNDTDPNDDNMHGTHVAGIAAAKSNNSMGIAGIAPESKILPIKVLQSNGFGKSTDIAMGIQFAVASGATVINLSLGSHTESLMLKDILSVAYKNAIIVASAGNDNMPILNEGIPSIANYPACYSFVLGVEAVQKQGSSFVRSSFSNYDPSGPIQYKNEFGYNYEIKAPGTQIFSTIPNGSYRALNGTSMATPIVSGAVALLKSNNNSLTNEEIFSRLIQTSKNGVIQINDALEANIIPKLNFLEYAVFDTLHTNPGDGDLKADAGETVGVTLKVLNSGSKANDLTITLALGKLEDPSLITFLTTSVNVGSVSSYGTISNLSNPFKLKINSNIIHNRAIVFEYQISASNTSEIQKGEITIVVSNLKELSGLLSNELTLTPDKLWVVNKSFRITSTGILNILPGTQITLEKEIVNDGIVNGLGEVNNRITVIGPKGVIGANGALNFAYTDFKEMVLEGQLFLQGKSLKFSYCNFLNVIRKISDPNSTHFFDFFSATVSDCTFSNFSIQSGFGLISMINPKFNFVDQIPGSFSFIRNNFDNISGVGFIRKDVYPLCGPCIIKENNFSRFSGIIWPSTQQGFIETKFLDSISLTQNNFLSGATSKSYYLVATDPESQRSEENVSNNYWGTTDTKKIDSYIFDFWDQATNPIANYVPFLAKPSSAAHGIVWKIHINGKNLLEEALEPIESGTVKFEVFFNRPMNPAYTPLLTFGLREPFTQNTILNNSAWNSDFTIWTAYFDVDYRTGDGINTVRVSDAIDNDGIKIPVESNQRFNFVIKSIKGLSNNLNAVPDFGQIHIQWMEINNNDILGYNLYRIASYQVNQNTILKDTVKVNSKLILNSNYTDSNLSPDTLYYYMITSLNANFRESDFSSSVSSKPLKPTAIINVSNELTFDDVLINNSQIKSLSVENIGQAELIINNIIYPNGFRSQLSVPVFLQAQEKKEIPVEFNPIEDKVYDGNIVIFSNSIPNPLTVKVKGKGILMTSNKGSFKDNVKIITNPFKDNIKLMIPDEGKINTTSIHLYDMNGKQISSKAELINGELFCIPLMELSDGVYILQLNYKNQSINFLICKIS